MPPDGPLTLTEKLLVAGLLLSGFGLGIVALVGGWFLIEMFVAVASDPASTLN